MRLAMIRAKAFAGEGVRWHKIMIDSDTIRVWDSVAGHYTTCHSLSKSAVARLLADKKKIDAAYVNAHDL